MKEEELSEVWAHIQNCELTLLRDVQSTVKAQVELWRKIPALAWKAYQHQSEYSSDLSLPKAYSYGIWPVCYQGLRWYADFWVDCETGMILNTGTMQEVEPAGLRPLLSRLQELDPEIICTRLERVCLSRNVSKNQPPCPVTDPFQRTEPLPEKVSNQIVEYSD